MSNQARYLEAWDKAYNTGDPHAFDGLLAPGYARQLSLSPGLGALDADGLHEAISTVRNAFPDMRTQIEAVVGDDDQFAIRWASEGTHLDTFLGVPATGRSIRTGGMTFCRFVDHQVVEEWVAWDLREILNALGVHELRLTSTPVSSQRPDDKLVRTVHRTFPTGVTVVTTMDRDGSPRGLAVNAFMSVSLDPPMILVSIAQSSRSHESLIAGESFAVNILGDNQQAVVAAFASSGEDKFANITWRPGRSGAPLLDGTAGWFEAETTQFVKAFTHTFLVGRITSAGVGDVEPLIYLGGELISPRSLVESIGTPGDAGQA